MRKLLLHRRRKQTLVDANILQARLGEFFVRGIDELLVVQAPWMLGQILVGVVADGVSLHRVGLEIVDGVIDLLHPTVVSGREYRMREHALASRKAVHVCARLGLHLVGEEPVLRYLRGGAANARHLGVAVEIDFLQVVGEHQVVDRLLLVSEPGVPAGLAHGLALIDESHDLGARTQKMRVHVHDELAGQLFRAIVRVLGLCSLGRRHTEDRPVGVVHGEECGRHAGRGLEEATPAHAQALGHPRSHLLDASLEFALLLRLQTGHEFVARNRLHGDGRGKQRFGGGQLFQLVGGKHAHGSSWGRRRGRALRSFCHIDGRPAKSARRPERTLDSLPTRRAMRIL